MSAEIQHKLLNYEQLPPEAVWEQIEQELNLAAGDQQLKEKLNGQQVDPPASAWSAIQAGLLSQTTEGISAKLLQAEVIPPASAWNSIEATLNERKVRKLPVVRYAVAASLIGLLGFAAIRIFTPSPTAGIAGNQIKKETPVKKDIEPVPLVKETTSEPVAVTTEDTRNDAALEQSKKTFAKLDLDRKQRSKIAANFRFSSVTDQVIADNNMDIADRYIVLMTPEGNFIRVSKKLGNMVCCVSGEEQDKECKDQVDKWRKQIACASANHPGNFGDILSLISSLQSGN